MEADIYGSLRLLRPNWPSADIEVLQSLEGGYSNANYKIRYENRYYALRVAGAQRPHLDRSFEARWLADLPSGLGAPLVAYDEATGAQLTHWVNGPLLVERTASPQQLLDYLKQLHQKLPVAARPYSVVQLTQHWLNGLAYPEWLNPIIEDLRSQCYPLMIAGSCHNDLNAWNIIVSDEVWTTLDWEFAGENDPLFDLVALFFATEQIEQIIDAANEYCGYSVDEQRLQSNVNAFWLREYAWARYEVSLGRESELLEEQIEVSLDTLKRLTE